MAIPMLFRFSLYGFLKNQKYYEAFWILAFRAKGLTFFDIGVLIAFREVCVNVLEIPTGVIADMYGRRRSMIFSMLGYIASFVIFAISPGFWPLFPAMLLFAVGEAFRTGTHKAMIFDWLASQNRAHEKTKVYGFTRAWSQVGSAVSALIAAGIVLASGNYNAVFWFSVAPYLIGMINLASYPKYLDGDIGTNRPSLASVARATYVAVRDSLRSRPLRKLFGESMAFEGSYTIAKEYLQPLLDQAALAVPLVIAWQGEKRTALLVGIVYSVLYLLSSYASGVAHVVSSKAGSDDRASRVLWLVHLSLFLLLIPALLFKLSVVAIVAFVALALLQNTWRPIYMSRIDAHSDAKLGATILSVDSQAESLFVMIMAPVIGFAVDKLGLWPVAVFGSVAALLVMVYQGMLFAPRRGEAVPQPHATTSE